MEKIQFDSGIREYRLNGMGVLRFNPGDPNLYARFLEAVEEIKNMEKKMAAQAGDHDGMTVLKFLQDADKQMKQSLNRVFGEGNDFDKILGGVNLLAIGANGERVVTNLFAALQPILLQGAEACAREQTRNAVERAKARRALQ